VRGADIPLRFHHVVRHCTGILGIAAIVAQNPECQIARLGKGQCHARRGLSFHLFIYAASPLTRDIRGHHN
jgi:hypothetical protein